MLNSYFVRLIPTGFIAEKPRVGQLGQFFREPCRKNYTLDWIMINEWHLLDGLDDLYHHAKFGDDPTTRAGCRCENMFFYRQDAWPSGMWVRLDTKFHVNRFTGWERGPQNIKNFHFLVKSRRREPLDRFLKIFILFLYAQLSYISVSNLTWFASQITEVLLRNRASVI